MLMLVFSWFVIGVSVESDVCEFPSSYPPCPVVVLLLHYWGYVGSGCWAEESTVYVCMLLVSSPAGCLVGRFIDWLAGWLAIDCLRD